MIILAVTLSLCLQTSVNVFVVNLAVTDFLLSFVAVVHSLSFLARHDFPGLDIICAIDVALAQICVGCSIFTLASVSINRYIIITKSTKNIRPNFPTRIHCPLDSYNLGSVRLCHTIAVTFNDWRAWT
ncbi:Dopamine D2-like receptor [Holothuria leucospilota]|uniref:Dopamine D2-like receptor n=1 Tax=Holothuria leucospilota TaxID=206669 RepID=A0A9Q1CBK3_HOLLE|nr:Dopamine D2-like receptor [Holothuria leucospilota]